MNHSHIGRARLPPSRGGPKPGSFRTGEANWRSAGPRLPPSCGGPKPGSFRTGEANWRSAGPRLQSSRGGPDRARLASYTLPALECRGWGTSVSWAFRPAGRGADGLRLGPCTSASSPNPSFSVSSVVQTPDRGQESNHRGLKELREPLSFREGATSGPKTHH